MTNHMDTTNIFSNYLSQKSNNTLSAQRIDLGTFADYCCSLDDNAPSNAADLQTNAKSWKSVTAKLVAGFIQWMLDQGFAINSINRKLSTVKTYAKLASVAGSLDYIEFALIRNIASPTTNEGKHLDQTRPIVRKGAKKATNTLLSQEQTQILKKHPNTPQGYRDALLMCLLLDHGLRVGEISLLKTADFDLETRQFTVYRPKLDLIQTLKMTLDTYEVVQTWFKSGCATTTHLLRGSFKSGQLNEGGMSERAIQTRVKVLGKEFLGVERLSPEDCRHYWATHALELGVDLVALRDAGGWKSLAMPSRYISSPEIANQRLKL